MTPTPACISQTRSSHFLFELKKGIQKYPTYCN